jgi:hypothetical protein
VDFGLQAQLMIPGGDLTNQVGSGNALGLGAQVRWDLSRGHAVVARVDRVEFSGTRTFDLYDGYGFPVGTTSADAKQTIISLGADYNYYFSRKVGEGFYLGGGLGFLQKDESYTAPAGTQFTGNPNQTKTRVYVDFNLGVALNKHVNLYMRTIAFGDERQADTWNSTTHDYQATYSFSTTFAFGAEFHF